MQNLSVTNLILLIVAGLYATLLLPSLYFAFRKKHHAGLASLWLTFFLLTGLMLPFLAFFSGHFWFYLGYSTLGFTLVVMASSFSFIIPLIKDHSGAGALLAPIMFNWPLGVVAIIAHLLFH